MHKIWVRYFVGGDFWEKVKNLPVPFLVEKACAYPGDMNFDPVEYWRRPYHVLDMYVKPTLIHLQDITHYRVILTSRV